MLKYELKAELIMRLAYKNGGIVEIEDVLNVVDHDLSYISDEVMCLLDFYGKTYDNTLSSKYGWTNYNLNYVGMEFARNGCFTGDLKRRKIVIIGAIAALISAIASLINLFI
ncbi:MAG: hypothetical protein RRY36_08510 [Bacteroidaceae bacterium]